MTTSLTSAKALLLALPLACVLAGCCCHAVPCLPDERNCPTDARRLYWTFGEEAVRRCPCGPDREFYGLKPTQWRSWPEGWRCNEGQWGEPIIAEPAPEYAESIDAPLLNDATIADAEPALGELVPNPFRRLAEKPEAKKNPPPSEHAAELAASENESPADPTEEPADETTPVAPTTTPVAVVETSEFEAAPLIKFPEMYKALAEIQTSASGNEKAEPSAAAKESNASPPAKSDLDATPSRGVPHVDESLSDRVQQHLLDNLTL
jgi:hypothetical protein